MGDREWRILARPTGPPRPALPSPTLPERRSGEGLSPPLLRRQDTCQQAAEADDNILERRSAGRVIVPAVHHQVRPWAPVSTAMCSDSSLEKPGLHAYTTYRYEGSQVPCRKETGAMHLRCGSASSMYHKDMQASCNTYVRGTGGRRFSCATFAMICAAESPACTCAARPATPSILAPSKS